jgi:hypothetical protein
VKLTLSLIAVMALSLSLNAPAKAQEPELFSYKWYRKDRVWSQYYCGGAYRPEGCDRWRRWRRWQWNYNQGVGEGPICHDSVRATGTQGESEESAYDRAVIAWQGQVQFLHGARYVVLKSARDATVTCAPSNIPDAIREKIGGTLYRCEIKARPCRQLPQKIDLGGGGR